VELRHKVFYEVLNFLDFQFELNQSGIETISSCSSYQIHRSRLNWTKVELRPSGRENHHGLTHSMGLNWTKVELRPATDTICIEYPIMDVWIEPKWNWDITTTVGVGSMWEVSLNWTKVELRLPSSVRRIKPPLVGLNWTKVELRPHVIIWFPCPTLTFRLNWTKVELRQSFLR